MRLSGGGRRRLPTHYFVTHACTACTAWSLITCWFIFVALAVHIGELLWEPRRVRLCRPSPFGSHGIRTVRCGCRIIEPERLQVGLRIVAYPQSILIF